jgi:hypothetical protein
MTANISIPIATVDNVLAVPLSAVFTEQGERYVYIQQEGKFERQPVQVGLADYFYVEVQEGLTAGQVVALEPPPGAVEMNQEEAAAGQTNRDRSGLRAARAGSGPALVANTNRTAGRILAGTGSTNHPAPLNRPQ